MPQCVKCGVVSVPYPGSTCFRCVSGVSTVPTHCVHVKDSPPKHSAPSASPAHHVAKAKAGLTAGQPEAYQYLQDYIGEDSHNRHLRLAAQELPHANMMGSPEEAQFLRLLASSMGATKIVEVGVFRGTTTLPLAQAVGPSGTVFALDITDEYVQPIGVPAWKAAGVDKRIQLVVGPAVRSMQSLIADHANTIDMVFIDADKPNYPAYYELAYELLRPGGVVAVDNVLWGGKVVGDVDPADVSTGVIKALNDTMRSDDRFDSVMTPFADGLYLGRKVA